MTNLTDAASFTTNEIYQIAGTDPVQGAYAGAAFGGLGIDNWPHQQLANRCAYIYAALTTIANGFFPYNWVNKTSNYNILTTDASKIINANAASLTFTLPNPNTMANQWVGLCAGSGTTLTVNISSGIFGGGPYIFYQPSSLLLNGGDIIFFISNGAAWMVADGNSNNILQVAYNVSSPPAADLDIQQGNRVAISFTSFNLNQLTSGGLPLRINCSDGALYKVTLVTSSCNSTNPDITLLPNNGVYGGTSFFQSTMEVSDNAVTALSTGAPNTLTPITTTPFLSNLSENFGTYNNCFYSDVFGGPSPSDTLNDQGNVMIELLLSTTPPAKMMKTSACVIGGACQGSCVWLDTSTQWYSLGTLCLSGATSATGTAIVERII